MTYHPPTYLNLTANKTLTYHDQATMVTTNPSAADLVITLPTSNRDARGMEITIMNIGTSNATGLTVAIGTGDTLYGTGITAAAGKGLINTHATEAVGDCITVVAGGANDWYLVSKIGTWARVS